MRIKVVPMTVEEVQCRTDRTASGSSEDVSYSTNLGSVFPEAVDRRESYTCPDGTTARQWRPVTAGSCYSQETQAY